MRLCFSLGTSLVLILVLLVGITSPVFALPGDETTVGELELTSTFECISVYTNFSGDNNENNSASFQWRETGGYWKQGMALTVDRRATVRSEDGTYTNDFQNQWRASILGLTPNTEYEVRVTFSDPDGVSPAQSIVGQVRTRDDNFVLGSGNTYYVSPAGNDSNPGTAALPFQTIQHAADNVAAGDTVYIMSGRYAETVTISTSGTYSNYITFLNYGSDTVTIDGQNTRVNMSISADYIRIKGLRMIESSDRGLTINDNSTNIVIEDCYFTGMGRSAIRVGTNWSNPSNITNITIQDCDIDITEASDADPHVISFENASGGGHVIRRNSLVWSGGTPSGYVDGIGGYQGALPYAAFCKNTDIYDNYLEGIPDDAIECDGGNINVRVWGNTMINCFDGVSDCACITGPFYVFRNTFWANSSGSQTGVKLGHEGTGHSYFYHNTFYLTDASSNGLKQTNEGLDNVVSRNNIYHCGRYIIEFKTGYGEGHGHDFDYDNLYSSDGTRFVYWGGLTFDDLAEFQAGTDPEQETNGMSVSATNEFVNAGSGDFRLVSYSQFIDQGEVLTGFNDANSPWPYSGSAPDIGAYEYGSGGPTNRPPVLSFIGNKSVNVGQVLQFTVLATDLDYDTLTYSASNLPQGATFNETTRTFSWTPTSSQAGTYPSVRFAVSDGSLTDSENITITVLSGDENQPPVLNAIGDKAITEEELLEFTVTATDPNDDALTLSADNLPSGASFDPESGVFSWTPTSGQADTYPNVHFEVSDGELTDEEYITITVSTLPEPLSLPLRVNAAGNAYIDSQSDTWQADQAYVFGSWGFYGTDNTIDRGTGHAISGTVDDRIYQTERYSLSGYRFNLGNGTYDVTLHFAETFSGITGPGQRVFDVSIEGQLVLDNLDIYSEAGYSTALEKVFTGIVVQDGQLNIEFTSFIEQPEINGIEILLAGGNYAPVLNPIGNKSITEEDLLEFTVTASDPNGDLLTFSADNLPDGASFDPETRLFSWTPEAGQADIYTGVHFEVSDGELTDYEDITITVLSVNNAAPVLDEIGDRSVREGELLEFTISAIDPDDDEMTFSAGNLPDGVSFDSKTGVFSWTPALGQRGNYSFVRFRVTDGVLTDTEYITITVTKNDPPVLDEIGNKNVREGNLLKFTISATDLDDDELTFSADNLPDGADFDPEARTFSWTPNSDQVGTYPGILFKVSDGTFSDVENITITVLITGNNAPVLGSIGDKTVNETESLEFTISATDPEDDPLTFSADELPDGASFDPETKTFSWTPELGQEGEYTAVHFEVSDGELTDYEDITITVNIPIQPGGGGGIDTGGDVGGGGGGDVGGDSEASSDEPDETPPVIKQVETSNVGTDSAVIRWTTTEPSTSQVEYWASPSQFSPLDETLVTEHEVYLTGLRPGTNYHYRTISQDRAGNLVTSPEYDFTTPGEPAAFTVSWLSISPAEADIGQEVTISALITNTGDAAGSYDVILSIDDEVEATESIIDQAGGESQEVAFTIIRENAGVFTVNVNGTTGTLVVSDAGEPETAIELFDITPNYESDTGVITFTIIDYGINESYYSTLFSQLDTELILKVGLDSEPLEEVILIASGQPEPDMSTGSLNYIPAEGWTSGTYTFRAELRTGEGVIETSSPVRLIITPAAAASVATWATLGEIIGGALIIALLVVLLILHRNRDMLRAQSLE